MNAILADENVPRASVVLLRGAGLDVAFMAAEAPGAADSAVLERARGEGRLLVTLDRDFGELIYRRRFPAPLGLVYLRFTPATPEEPGTVLSNLFAREEIELQGRFTVVARNRVRQRPLP